MGLPLEDRVEEKRVSLAAGGFNTSSFFVDMKLQSSIKDRANTRRTKDQGFQTGELVPKWGLYW